MDAFVARQPILDGKQSTFGYELLFRSGWENAFPDVDPDVATSRVLSDSAAVFHPQVLTAGSRGFINITRRALLDELYQVASKDWLVVELLETVEPDAEVIDACKRLKEVGYLLALDDFVDHADFEPLIDLADFVKVDFMASDADERRRLVDRYGSRVTLLAEKVANEAEVREGLELGYDLFQGYFFCEPEIIHQQEVPAFKLNYLRLIREVSKPTLDLDEIAGIVRQEMSLSVKLLRLLNTPAFGFRRPISSVRKALEILGERPMKRWVTLLALTELGSDKPQELIVTCMVRARFGELLGQAIGLEDQMSDLFLMGMLSLLDTIIGRPLPALILDLGLPGPVASGLLDDTSELAPVRLLLPAQESGNHDLVMGMADALGASEDCIRETYAEAVIWAGQVFRQSLSRAA